MPKFKIYAGLSGGFGGAHFCEVYECGSQAEAETYAREVAIEEYESYGGYHGLYTWDSMRQEIADDEYDGDIEAVDPEDVEMLQDMIIAAVNEALRAADVDSANNMSRLTGGLNLGGLF